MCGLMLLAAVLQHSHELQLFDSLHVQLCVSVNSTVGAAESTPDLSPQVLIGLLHCRAVLPEHCTPL